MNSPAIYGVLNNLDEGDLKLILEELAFHLLTQEAQQPLIVDPFQSLAAMDWLPGAASPLKKQVKKTIAGRIPLLGLEQILALGKTKSRESWDMFQQAISFFVLRPEQLNRLPDIPFPILLLVKPESDTASFMYQCFDTLKNRWKPMPTLPVIIWKTEYIEQAADTFVELVSELKKVIRIDPPFEFLGHLAVSEEKRDVVRNRPGLSLIESFPEDQFHGQIRRLVRNLSKTPGVFSTKIVDSLRETS